MYYASGLSAFSPMLAVILYSGMAEMLGKMVLRHYIIIGSL